MTPAAPSSESMATLAAWAIGGGVGRSPGAALGLDVGVYVAPGSVGVCVGALVVGVFVDGAFDGA